MVPDKNANPKLSCLPGVNQRRCMSRSRSTFPAKKLILGTQTTVCEQNWDANGVLARPISESDYNDCGAVGKESNSGCGKVGSGRKTVQIEAKTRRKSAKRGRKSLKSTKYS